MDSSLQIDLVPCLNDNYAYLLHDMSSGVTGIVDPGEVGPVVRALEAKGYTLDFIFNTHHHADHTGGNLGLKKKYDAKVVGPKVDKARIPGIDIPLSDETWKFGNHEFRAIFTPGHTLGHVCYYFPESKAVFTGDTLFSVGCGRVFEGTMDQMWSSLSTLSLLPEDTRAFVGHEYTAVYLSVKHLIPLTCGNQSNIRFAVTVEPHNEDLLSQRQLVEQLRQKGQPTIPTTIGQENSFNPFLRPFVESVRQSLNKSASENNVEVFTALRLAKDKF